MTSEIEQVEARLKEATLKNDAGVTEELLADDWLNINPNGTVTDKKGLLEIIDSFAFQSIEDAEIRIRLYGDVALVTGLSTRVLAASGTPAITRHVRFTRVWVNRGARWQVVSSQSTFLAANS